MFVNVCSLTMFGMFASSSSTVHQRFACIPVREYCSSQPGYICNVGRGGGGPGGRYMVVCMLYDMGAWPGLVWASYGLGLAFLRFALIFFDVSSMLFVVCCFSLIFFPYFSILIDAHFCFLLISSMCIDFL